MNTSTIMMAFIIAGFICVGIHDLLIGPIAYGPNNVMHQVAKQKGVPDKPKALKKKGASLKR